MFILKRFFSKSLAKVQVIWSHSDTHAIFLASVSVASYKATRSFLFGKGLQMVCVVLVKQQTIWELESVKQLKP